MQNQNKPRMTLAQSFIEEGLITNPNFIKAAQVQASDLQKGSFRLIGAILSDLQNDKPASK